MLLHGTITDNHHVFQDLSILFQRDVDSGTYRNRDGLEAHERNGNLATLGCRDREITVEVRRSATLLTDHADSSAKDRFAGIILNITLHSDLRKSTQGDE